MSDGQINQVSQALGRLAASIEGVKDSILGLGRQNELLWQEMRTIKHDQREVEQKVQSSYELISRQIAEAQRQATEAASQVALIRRPVEEMLTLRARITGGLIVLGAVGSVVITLGSGLWWALKHLRLIG